MWREFVVALGAFMFVASGHPVAASEVLAPSIRAGFMRIHGPVDPPSGFVALCRRDRSLCTRGPAVHARPALSTEAWRDLVEVNDLANTSIEAKSDQELYGESEYWTLPRGKGDCEDYALLKQRLLVERGWPIQALLLTVVRDEEGNGHAVLTARTGSGDFVLDNRHPAVRGWGDVPYVFVKRQSYLDPAHWVSLQPRLRTETDAMASLTR